MLRLTLAVPIPFHYVSPSATPNKKIDGISKHAVRGEPVSTINHQHNSIDKTRRLRTNKNRRLLNIDYAPKAAKRNVLLQTLFHHRGHQPLHPLRVFDRPRGDRVHTNPIAPPLNREIPRQRIHSSLRRRNRSEERRVG